MRYRTMMLVAGVTVAGVASPAVAQSRRGTIQASARVVHFATSDVLAAHALPAGPTADVTGTVRTAGAPHGGWRITAGGRQEVGLQVEAVTAEPSGWDPPVSICGLSAEDNGACQNATGVVRVPTGAARPEFVVRVPPASHPTPQHSTTVRVTVTYLTS